jgi:hypothetical protein
MAVVIMPDTIDEKANYQVILHFHGWGFRQWEEGKDPYAVHDPYAGYLVASGKTASKKGTVRDVDQEHWEQQIKAVMEHRRADQPHIIAILAQGRGKQDFGNVPSYAYVQAVLKKAGIGVTQYTVVLSAHSGGGSVLAGKVGADAVAVDPAKLAKDAPRAAAPQAADLVVLFDAEGIVATAEWAAGQIKALGTALDADPANAQQTLAASAKFRGYFAKGGNYVKKYDRAATVVKTALDALDAKWTTLSPGVVAVPDLFRFVQVDRPGVDHEHLIGAVPVKDKVTKKEDESVGALADALNVTTDPTRDRADEYRPKK